MTNLVNLNLTVQKEENAKAYKLLSDIINEEIKKTNFKVFEYFPKQVALFSFTKSYQNKFSLYRGFIGNIAKFLFSLYRRVIDNFLFWTDSEPLLMDGGPPRPHIRVLNNNYMDFAKKIKEEYKEKSGIEMTIEYVA